MRGFVVVAKDGRLWDKSPFTVDARNSMAAAMQDGLDWRRKILREEPEASVQIEVIVIEGSE